MSGSASLSFGEGRGKTLYIIKIGGNVIDNSEKLHQFLKCFASLKGNKILVHGGGKMATKLANEMRIEAKMVNGRRITDIETLRIVTMVYAGLISKNLVAQLQMFGCNALGLSGADGNLITAQKRAVQQVFSKADGITQKVDFGFVGDLDDASVNSESLLKLLDNGFIPVFSAITHDGASQLLNTNADTIASALAVAMAKYYQTQLVYCFEKKGVLIDVDDESSVIREINPEKYEDLKAKGIVADGMLPKLHNAFEAIKNGVSAVYIGKADDLDDLDDGQEFGTKLVK
ncbi:acetylglutamate kinase [Pelobium manganitolerans]|uniref:Acetylglutamate kinase n=1 Tax=Pelobium manganitolerans TaxID=1842495 RepID=A0A419S7A5_9SPHI|nr:acetylglutamate kinase [Pelobium manganitolerans]RKD17215.1 acetylglutamate kinase [Pelobium manganitolerans]